VKATVALLQWLKGQGLHPEVFQPEDEFYVLAWPRLKKLMELTQQDLRNGAVWVPSIARLVSFLQAEHLAKNVTLKELEPGLWLAKVEAEFSIVEGSGRTEVDAVIRALQHRQTRLAHATG